MIINFQFWQHSDWNSVTLCKQSALKEDMAYMVTAYDQCITLPNQYAMPQSKPLYFTVGTSSKAGMVN